MAQRTHAMFPVNHEMDFVLITIRLLIG